MICMFQRHLDKGGDLLEEASQVSGHSGTGLRDLARSLKNHLRGFSERLEDTRERLEDTSRCFYLLDKVSAGYQQEIKWKKCFTHFEHWTRLCREPVTLWLSAESDSNCGLKDCLLGWLLHETSNKNLILIAFINTNTMGFSVVYRLASQPYIQGLLFLGSYDLQVFWTLFPY